jgi:hypothetical protein
MNGQNKPSEESIYENENVKATRTRLVVGPATYTIAAISSLRIIAIEPSKSTFHWLATFGGFFVLMGILLALGSEVLMLGTLLLAGGFALAVCAAIVSKRHKPTFGLYVTTTAREQQLVESPTLENILSVESALHHGISMRG